KIQIEEEAALGRGKGQRKVGSYREAYSPKPMDTLGLKKHADALDRRVDALEQWLDVFSRHVDVSKTTQNFRGKMATTSKIKKAHEDKCRMVIAEPEVTNIADLRPIHSNKTIEATEYRKCTSKHIHTRQPTKYCCMLIDKQQEKRKMVASAFGEDQVVCLIRQRFVNSGLSCSIASINEGPSNMGRCRDKIASGIDAPYLGLERDRVVVDLSQPEKDRLRADVRATNILLQGLPRDIYKLINHNTNAKDIWDNVKMLLEGSESTKDDHES
nr:protein chromatin remodeling 4 [Tanacetum cinerariifolium]